MHKLNKLIILISLPIFLMSCHRDSERKSASETMPKTMVVEAKPNQIVLFFKAKIEPIKETNISSPIDAVIKTLNFTYGQRVNKGQLLMTLISDQLKKDYQETLTAFLKAKADYHNQNIKSEGIEELWEIQALSKNQYIEEKQQITNYYLSYRQAELRLKELAEKANDQKLTDLLKLNIDEINKIELALAANSGEMNLIAPSDGIALYPEKTSNDNNASSRILEGTAVKAGQGLLEIGDMSGLALYINVNEININTIKPEQKVTITGVAFPGITLHGQVKEVDVQAKSNTTSGLPTFPVKIEIPQLSEQELQKIHVGMSAEVKLIIEQPPSIRIPLKALIEQDNKAFVKIRASDGDIKTIEVIPGNTAISDVIILNGLQPGDKIVLPD